MSSKLNQILNYFKPYKIKEVEKEFIELNKRNWEEEYSGEGYCVVEGHVTCPASIIDKARIAKAIQEKTGAKPIVFLRFLYKR